MKRGRIARELACRVNHGPEHFGSGEIGELDREAKVLRVFRCADGHGQREGAFFSGQLNGKWNLGARHVGFEPCGLGAVVQARFADCDFEQACLGGRDADCLPAVFCDFERGATVSIGKATVKREASFEHGRDVLRVKTTSVRVCACAIERQRIERADHFESLKPLSFFRAVDIECVAQFIDRKGLHDIADIAELHIGGACKARHV